MNNKSICLVLFEMDGGKSFRNGLTLMGQILNAQIFEAFKLPCLDEPKSDVEMLSIYQAIIDNYIKGYNLQLSLPKLENDNKLLSEQNARLLEEIEQLRNERSAAEKKTDTHITTLQTQNELLTTELAQQQLPEAVVKLVNLEQQLEVEQKKNHDLTIHLTSVETANKTLSAQLLEKVQQIEKIDGETTKLNQQLNLVQKKNQESHTQINTLQAKVKKLEEQNSELTTQLEDKPEEERLITQTMEPIIPSPLNTAALYAVRGLKTFFRPLGNDETTSTSIATGLTYSSNDSVD